VIVANSGHYIFVLVARDSAHKACVSLELAQQAPLASGVAGGRRVCAHRPSGVVPVLIS